MEEEEAVEAVEVDRQCRAVEYKQGTNFVSGEQYQYVYKHQKQQQ